MVSIFPFSLEICPSLPPTASDPRLRGSSLFVYSIAELLRLLASPLISISKESQIVVDDLVAHHVGHSQELSGRAAVVRAHQGGSRDRVRREDVDVL
jgi:hypothetical protein